MFSMSEQAETKEADMITIYGITRTLAHWARQAERGMLDEYELAELRRIINTNDMNEGRYVYGRFVQDAEQAVNATNVIAIFATAASL